MAGNFVNVFGGGSGTDPASEVGRGQILQSRETIFGVYNKIAERTGVPQVQFENQGKDPSLGGAVLGNLASFIPGISSPRPPTIFGGDPNIPDTMLPADIHSFFMDAGASEEEAFEALGNLSPEVIVAAQYKRVGAYLSSVQRDILGTPGADRQALIRELRLQEALPGEPTIQSEGATILDASGTQVLQEPRFRPKTPQFQALFDSQHPGGAKDILVTAPIAKTLIENDTIGRYGPATTKSEITQTNIEKTTKGKVEVAFRSLDQLEGQLNQVMGSFDPKMLTYLGRTKQQLLTIADKIQPLGPGVTRDEFVRQAITFQNAWTVINQGIKFITGAQMSQREAQRLARQFPSPAGGKDIPPDSPTLFGAKAQNLLFWTQLLLARNRFVLKEGKISGLEDSDSENYRNYDDPLFGKSLTGMINTLDADYNAAWEEEIKTLQIKKGTEPLTPEMVEGARGRAAVRMVEIHGIDPTLILDTVANPNSLVRDGLDIDQLTTE